MKVVLITGAGSGIGLALAEKYANAGNHVYAGVRNPVQSPAALSHPNIHILKLDVTSEEDISSAMSDMGNAFGLPDILINNAGINQPGTFEECNTEIWHHIFNVNFFAPIALCQKILPHMRQQRHGTIVMLSSLSAEIGLPYDGPYAASKAALNRAAECLSSEVKPFGVNIIIAEPGAVKSNLNAKPIDLKNPIEDYRPLNLKVQQNAPEGKQGENAEVIAAEILQLTQNPAPPLFCPIGDQARKITQIIKQANSLERDRIIRDASGLADWITQDLTKNI